MEAFKEIQQLFESSPLNLWVIQYGITHGAMIIAVFKNSFTERHEITLFNCKSYSGDLDGEPYNLTIKVTQDVNGEDVFVIHDDMNRLNIVFGEMTSPTLDWRQRLVKIDSTSS